jgi:anti-sigma factor RsiW
MNCDCYCELWSKYCEGELDERSREELEEHLASCRICAEGMAAFRSTLEFLKDLPPLEVSPAFDARLARALAEERLRERDHWYGRLGRLGVRIAPAAASIAAVLVVSLVLAVHFAPPGGNSPEGGPWEGLTAAGPAGSGPVASEPVTADRVAVSLPGRGQVRVEPWSLAGQWPQSLADSTASGYRMRFVLDKIILEGEEAARASVPDEEQDVQPKYVTF